ncbi:MAG: hypothetical protein ACT4OZ_13085 [Gemmatimonadota bacterium]
MRRSIVPVTTFLVIACAGGGETPATDSATAMMSATMISDADIAGTWTGTMMPMDADTVLVRWKQVCGGGHCTGTSEGSADTTMSMYTVSGDSAVGTTTPYADPMFGGTRVVDNWVARPSAGRVTGTGMLKMADRPDSVLMRYRFEGSRAP